MVMVATFLGSQKGQKVVTTSRMLFPYALLAVLTLLVLTTISPHRQPLPATDSSVFLYVADAILEGKVPYRDIWDHKGPLIYYIDALGLLLADGSRWGVWFLELLFVLGAILLGYRLLREIFGTTPALLASAIGSITLTAVLDWGNLTEEYALLFQFAALGYFWQALKQGKPFPYLGVGVVAALAFLLRPNLIGVPIGIGVFAAFQFIRNRTKMNGHAVLLFAAGALFPVMITLVYFGSQNALAALWDQVFHYNFVYSDVEWIRRGEVVLFAFDQLELLGLLGFAGWVVVILNAHSSSDWGNNHAPFLRVAALILPVEVLLMILPGNQFPHYLMTLLPILIFFTAALLSVLFENLTKFQRNTVTFGLLLAFLPVPIGFLWPITEATFRSAWENGGIPIVDISSVKDLTQAINYIEANTEEGQEVLFLGNTLAVSWFTNRPSPTRFVYQAPLYNANYATPEMIDEFLGEIAGRRSLIIDPRAFYYGLEADLDNVPERVKPIFVFLQDHYVFVEELSLTRWRVYEYRGMP